MKKTLLVAALAAGFAGVAHAESSVTLYGIVDAGFGVTKQTIKTDGNKIYSNRNVGAREGLKNGNRWGLKGSEDLGNGTAAIFQLESGFNLADGNSKQDGRLFGRKAIIGLSGESWGTFTIGRQKTAADDFIAPLDPFDTSFGQASANSTFGDSIGAYKDAAIKYISPNFAGFAFGVSVTTSNTKTFDAVGTQNTVDTKDNGVSVALGYNNAGLEFAANYDYSNVTTKTTPIATGITARNEAKAKSWNVGLAYDFDVVKAHLMYGQQHDAFVSDAGLAQTLLNRPNIVGGDLNRGGLRAQSWLAGLSAPVGENGKVIFSYQGGRIKNKEVNDNARINTHIWSLGYTHALSKRTSVYAVGSYGESKFKDKSVAAGGFAKAKLKSVDAAIGLNHRF